MLTELEFTNFKSWRRTGNIRFAPLTGFFGANSSGKTAILQMLLLLKQTAESSDPHRVLHFGDENSYVDLGTGQEVIFRRRIPAEIDLRIRWRRPRPLKVLDPERSEELFQTDDLQFEVTIETSADLVSVQRFAYQVFAENKQFRFELARAAPGRDGKRPRGYGLKAQGYKVKRVPGRPWPLPAPGKFYRFPDETYTRYQNVSFLGSLVSSFEELLRSVFYLGPLREYPHRIYTWAGDRPRDVGLRGELAVHALLASEAAGIRVNRGYRKKRRSIQEMVAFWLRELGLVHSFSARPLVPGRKEYEVKVRHKPRSAEVALTDVGFGVSQILPVIVLCYYAPENSTIIFEQPEIHLHPSVQAGLADVLVDAIKTRNVQIVLESHSEHLLRRIQRRIAEERLSREDAALYFVSSTDGESTIEELQLDEFGNIQNWPKGFFGDELGELLEMTRAAAKRRQDPVLHGSTS